MKIQYNYYEKASAIFNYEMAKVEAQTQTPEQAADRIGEKINALLHTEE